MRFITDCISKINNAQIDNAKNIDVVMGMYNSVEYSKNYSKNLGSLWQCYNAGGFIDFPDAANNSSSFSFKQKLIGQRKNDATKVVEINVPLKYLGNFWRTFEMSLINCEIKVLKEHLTGINSKQKQQYRDTTIFRLPN